MKADSEMDRMMDGRTDGEPCPVSKNGSCSVLLNPLDADESHIQVAGNIREHMSNCLTAAAACLRFI